MYRLDLSDPRAALPVAVYAKGSNVPDRLQLGLAADANFDWKNVAFFALDRPKDGVVPIYAAPEENGTDRLNPKPAERARDAAPLFFAYPPQADERPSAVVPLYEYVHGQSGRRAYTTDADWSREGYERSEKPLAYVWPNPGK
jgi:hypothetical protein